MKKQEQDGFESPQAPNPTIPGTEQPAGPGQPQPQPAGVKSFGVTVGTLAWGVIFALLGLVLLAVSFGAKISLWATLLVVLGVGGLALLAAALISLRR